MRNNRATISNVEHSEPHHPSKFYMRKIADVVAQAARTPHAEIRNEHASKMERSLLRYDFGDPEGRKA